MSEGVKKNHPLRPFVFRKALSFFIAFVFCDCLLAEEIKNTDSNGVFIYDNLINTAVCDIESIKLKQALYKTDAQKAKYNQVSVSKKSPETIIPSSEKIEEIGFNLIETTPHNTDAYTQGLVYYRNHLYESTGGLGLSDIRKIDLATGRVIKFKALPDKYFAEGITLVGNRLIQLTLKKNTALVYDINSLELLDQFEFSGDGWGVVKINNNLLLSDGSSVLRRVNLENYQLQEERQVTVNGIELEGINEMEIINGMIYANIWPTDCIAIIDPEEYRVVAWLNLTGLYPEDKRLNSSSVLNGIAYEPSQHKLMVTGKNWPYIFHLSLNEFPINFR